MTYAYNVSMFRFCAIARVAFHLLVNSVEKTVLLIRLIKVKALALIEIMTRNIPKMLILCNIICYIPRYYVVCKFLKFYVKTDYFSQLCHNLC